MQDLDSSGAGVVLVGDPRYVGYPLHMLPDVENPAPRQAAPPVTARDAALVPAHPEAETIPPRW